MKEDAALMNAKAEIQLMSQIMDGTCLDATKTDQQQCSPLGHSRLRTDISLS